jgi:hypothetical protein
MGAAQSLSSLDERRQHVRRAPLPADGIVSARVRAGSIAEVINVSPRGALVETPHRLLPGTLLDLRIDGLHRHASVRAHVIHCEVFSIVEGRLRFRGGVLFERPITWLNVASDRRLGPEDSVSIRLIKSDTAVR